MVEEAVRWRSLTWLYKQGTRSRWTICTGHSVDLSARAPPARRSKIDRLGSTPSAVSSVTAFALDAVIRWRKS
ncbi:hypothetical protein M8494_04910 [Serratia ureilytica]